MEKYKHLHKILGYGLTNLEHNDEQFTDSRLDPDGVVFCKEREDVYHLRNFYAHLLKDTQHWGVSLFSIETYEPYLFDCLHLLPKDGIMAFVPPDKAAYWHRRDDIIDAVIEREFFGMETNCGQIAMPLPPYLDFMNAKTGDILDPEEVKIYGEKTLRVDDKATTPAARKQLNISLNEGAKRMGFADANEADKLIVPAIPDIIVEFVRWLKIFKEPETILQLRPLTLSYWV